MLPKGRPARAHDLIQCGQGLRWRSVAQNLGLGYFIELTVLLSGLGSPIGNAVHKQCKHGDAKLRAGRARACSALRKQVVDKQ